LAARGERKGRWEWAGGALWAERGGGPAGEKKKRREQGQAFGPRLKKKGMGRGKRGRGLESFLLSFFSNLFKLIFETFEIELFFKL
jgi:hypothetical protein